MTNRQKAAFVMETLERLYPDPAVPLHHQDSFTLLVAVVLSAQSTDACVNRVTPELFSRAATPQAIAAMSARQIEDIIRPCGLAPQKARWLQGIAKALVEKYGGEVPASLEALEALPGVGHKTASVVLAQAFGKATFPVDTHIHRVMHRWGLSSGKSVEQTERDCRKLFPRDRWAKLHLQLVYFGREYCRARNHEPSTCPLCSKLVDQ